MTEVTKEYPVVIGAELDPEIDVPHFHSLFLNATHSVPPRHPLFAYHATKYWAHGMQYANQMISFPTCKGFHWRHYKGGIYCTPIVVRDEEERREREVIYKERLRYWIENYDRVWPERIEELKRNAEELRSLDFEKASGAELYRWIHRSIVLYARMWEIHMEVLQATAGTYIAFSEMCRERFGMTTTTPEYQKLLTGFDNKIAQVNKKLWDFGARARNEGLESIFIENEPKQIIPKLEETEAGRRWVKDFYQFLEVDGWWPITLMEFSVPYWLEDPSIPIETIKANLEKEIEYNLPQIREGLAKQREEAVAALLAKVPEEERRDWESMLRLAQKTSSFSEEHCVYTEFLYHASLRYCYLKIAKRLVEAGTIDQTEDIHFLIPEEIEEVVLTPEFFDLRPIVSSRRTRFEEWLKTPQPPIFTDRPGGIMEAVEKDLIPTLDPIGFHIVIGEMPTVKPELKADLYGVCGAPGEVEGKARVIFNLDELGKLEKGEILVAVSTDSNWTAVFPRLKGAITDRGGSLSHAAIIGREFAIPVVTNTFEATSKIKTGQRVRIVADEGVVYILDK